MIADFLVSGVRESIDSLVSYTTGGGNQKWIDQVREMFEKKKKEYKDSLSI